MCNLNLVQSLNYTSLKWKKRYIGFSKMRHKTSKSHKLSFTLGYYRRLATLKTVLEQQQSYFETGISSKNRIVSIAKDYTRSIVRGKEVKPVEFEAKVNKLQIYGINFIEHLSFNAFNEGTRLQSTVYKAQSLTINPAVI